MKILFYPNGVAGGQRMLHYLKHLNIEWTKDINEEGITHIHHYNYANRIDRCPEELWAKSFKEDIPIINVNMLNVKKDFIDERFNEVFGYRLMIDPTQHYGFCFVRSTQNAIHQGQFIECPISPFQIDTKIRRSGKGEPHKRIYTRIIDTRMSKDFIRDFRFVVMGGEPVFLFEKHIKSDCIFHACPEDMSIHGHTDYSKFFSNKDIELIKTFLLHIGCSFGEIDVLRDNSTGKMYICDVNPVPSGGALSNCLWGGDVIEYLSNIYKNKYLSC